MKDNNHVVKIRLSKPMTDERLYSLLKDCSIQTSGSYNEMEDVWSNYSLSTNNPLADKLVDFVFNHCNGRLLPDRWDYYEPVRKIVDDNTAKHLKEICSRPSLIFLKRTKRPQVSITIQNNEFPYLEPYRDLISKLTGTEILVFPDARRKFELEEWYPILQDLCREMETDYGYIRNMDSEEVLAHVFSIPYLSELNRDEKEILGIRRMLEVIRIFEDTPYPTLGWYSKLFYPFIKDRVCKDYIQIGLHALNLLRDTLSLINKQNYYYGLRLNMNRTIRNIGGIRWDDPNNYWDSVVFLSRVDLRETFHYPDDKESFKIYPLPKDLSPLFILFDRVYFKEKSNEVLLIP